MKADPDLHKRVRTTPDLIPNIRRRSQLLSEVRRFFDENGFLEVTTPCMLLAPDPALHLDSFTTLFSGPDEQHTRLFMRTSPEHHMKRMLVAGLDRIYQIGPFFRNGEMTGLHNPEFTGLEWYQAGSTVEQAMDLTEDLVRRAVESVLGRLTLNRGGRRADLKPAFTRLSIRTALSDIGGIQVPDDYSEHALREAIQVSGIACAPGDAFDDLINRVLIERVEPAMERRGPVFLYDYPAPMAALARLRPEHPCVAERFELFICGLELCNGYGELTDSVQQRERFETQLEQRRQSGLATGPLDEAFLEALACGMPSASGNALGLDRMTMLVCEAERLDEVMAFPLNCELSLPV